MDQNHFWNLLAKQLSGEASPEELTELEALMKAYPDLSYAAQNITDLWAQREKISIRESEEAFQKHRLLLDDDFILPDETNKEITDIQIAPRGRKKKQNLAIAAFFVFSLMTGGWLIWTKPTKETNKLSSQNAEISTRLGSRSKLVLPDSSVVWLNAGSKLTYDPGFGITNRNTTLTGEAFFEVKKSTVPFIIHTGGVQIKVLGTAFNVKSYPNEKTTETSLIRGRVEITLDKRPGEKFILKPFEKLVVANEVKQSKPERQTKQPIVVLKELTHINDSTIFETSWVENKLVFHDESLEEVAKKMERWYNVRIEIKDEKLAQMQVGGGPFENESIEQALMALQIAFNFKFTIKGNQITITH